MPFIRVYNRIKGNLEEIITADGTSSSMTVDVSGLPSGDLEIVYALRGTSTEGFAQITYNGVTTATYNCTFASIDTTPTLSGSANDGASRNYIVGPSYLESTGTANLYSMGTAIIPFYKDTTKAKIISSDMFSNPGSGIRLEIWGGTRIATDAITSITFTASVGNWASGSFLRAKVLRS